MTTNGKQSSFQILDEDGKVRPMNPGDWRTMVDLADREQKIRNPAMIPTRTIASLNRYANQGIRTGDFLYQVLTNNLRGACSFADIHNLEALPAIVAYCFQHLPSGSWGSEAKVAGWLAKFKPADEDQP